MCYPLILPQNSVWIDRQVRDKLPKTATKSHVSGSNACVRTPSPVKIRLGEQSILIPETECIMKPTRLNRFHWTCLTLLLWAIAMAANGIPAGQTVAQQPTVSDNKVAETGEKPAETRTQDGPTFKKAVKIGMVQIAGTLEEKFRTLKELGFDGVELDSPSELTPEEVLAAIQATGLPVHGVVDSVHWNSTLSDPDPAVRAKGLEALKTAIRDAHAFGASSVLLVPAVCNDSVNYEQAWERSIEQIRLALPLAEELQIDILLENVWNNFLATPQETARYIDEIGHPRVGAYYDVGNSLQFAPPLEWIETLGPRIKKLDIKDYDLELAKKEGGHAGFRADLLEGSCDWPAITEELRSSGFSGWGTAEIRGGDRDRLAEIARRMDRIFATDQPRSNDKKPQEGASSNAGTPGKPRG